MHPLERVRARLEREQAVRDRNALARRDIASARIERDLIMRQHGLSATAFAQLEAQVNGARGRGRLT